MIRRPGTVIPLTLVALIGAVLGSGCVSHRAEVTPAQPPGDGIALRGRVLKPGEPAVISGPLPSEVPVTLWRQDSDGNLFRSDTVLRSPTPWWQRFPSDVITDAVLPGQRVVAQTFAPVWEPAGGHSIDGLDERARRAGYAHPQEPSSR